MMDEHATRSADLLLCWCLSDLRNLHNDPAKSQESVGDGDSDRYAEKPTPWGLWERGIVWYLKDR